jgi:uncharacterized membrane protein
MSTLSVWRFDTPDGAEKAVTTLDGLAQQQLVTVHDAATVSWPEGAKKPRTRQLNDLAGAGALGGAFWGMLFGLLFLVPLLGAAIGAAIGAAAGPSPASCPTSGSTTTSSSAPATRPRRGRRRCSC